MDSEHEAERDRLRLECSTLFDQKRAIEMQMKTIQIRLQWLDDKIDGGEGLLHSGGTKRKFALTQQTQHDESQTVEGGKEVKFELLVNDNEKKKGGDRNKSNNSMSLTQPEEYLTDPYTQQPEEYLTDPSQELELGDVITNDNNVASSKDKTRRISTSPPIAEMFASKTPPGLKPSAPPTSTVVNPYAVHAEKRGTTNANNPFQDLWNSNESTNHLNAQSSAKSSKKVRTSGANTLEKYFDNTQSSNSAAAAQGGKVVRNPYGDRQSLSNNNRQKEATNGSSAQKNNTHPWNDRMMYHLQNTFGIAQFRGHQEEIINATLQDEDAFVVMRTGGGKSLTYQLPAILELESPQRKVSIVISPLISLIRDQEEQMNQMKSGSAVSFTSGMAGGTAEHARRWGLVRDPNGGVALIFVTPEKVSKSPKFRGEMEKLHEQGRLGRFVIDECHCACQWGHDFRPDYTKLGILKHHFPSISVLAVTATASERVRKDCANILKLGNDYHFFRSTANRPNLNYSVKCKPDSKDAVVKDMVAFIKENHVGEAGIIYTFSKKEADDVAGKLCANGIIARSYHSGVHETRKNQVQSSWMRNQTQVVVATIAFGLGINKPDVRFVLHHSLSKSLEAYYQESGRAGRNGQPANCVLYYSPKDVPRMLGMIHGEAGEPTLWAMVRYGQAHGDDALCRHVILATLGEADNSMGMTLLNLQRNNTTTALQQVGAHCQTVAKVVEMLTVTGENITINQLVTKWRAKADDGIFSFVNDNPPGKDLSKEDCERVIVYLLLQDVFHPNIVFTAYTSIVYIILGPMGPNMLASTNPRAEIGFPLKPKRKQSASSKNSPTNPLAVSCEDGWISTAKAKSTKTKTNKATGKTKTGKAAGKPKGNAKKSKTSKVSKKKATTSKALTIVEINSSSSSSESEDDDNVLARRRAANRKRTHKQVILEDSSNDSDSDFSDF